MRLQLILNMKNIKLPVSYRRGIQAFLYSSLPARYAASLHETEAQGVIKPFTFSDLKGPYSITDHNEIVFRDSACLYIASSDYEFLSTIYNRLSKTAKIDLCSNFIDIAGIEILENESHDGTIRYRTLSPITVYKTAETGYRQFYSPEDDEFPSLILDNISHKYIQLFNEEMNDYFNIYMPEKIKRRVCSYKNIKYVAYDFSMKIDTTKKIHNLIMDLGIGTRNSIGFGMLEKISH